MSTASNNNNQQNTSRESKTHERPSSTYADAQKQAGLTRAGDATVPPPVASSPAISASTPEVPAREDTNPISFQRNAISARLSDDERARLSQKLG